MKQARRSYDPAGSVDTFAEPFTEACVRFGRPQCRRTADDGQDGQKPSVQRLSQPADFARSRQTERRRSKRNLLWTIGRLGGASRRGQRLLRCHMDVGVDHRLGLVDPAQRRPDQLRLRLVGWAASRIASVSTRVSSAGSSAAISRTAAAGSTRQGTNELVHSDDVALLENLPRLAPDRGGRRDAWSRRGVLNSVHSPAAAPNFTQSSES